MEQRTFDRTGDCGSWPCVESPHDVAAAARTLAAGGIVACAFANFYALVASPDRDVVRHVNAVKGRPLDQVGSVTTTRDRILDCFEWSQVGPRHAAPARTLVETFFDVGPFGFRGPASRHVPDHLTQLDAGMRTTQVIAPGRDCPSNVLLETALAEVGVDVLYITSANRSRHLTGAVEEPAHWTASGIAADFRHVESFTILAHRDEQAARARYPMFATTSVTLASFHTIGATGDDRPKVTIDRHGSLPVDDVRRIAEPLGFDIELAPDAVRRLEPRRYSDAA